MASITCVSGMIDIHLRILASTLPVTRLVAAGFEVGTTSCDSVSRGLIFMISDTLDEISFFFILNDFFAASDSPFESFF